MTFYFCRGFFILPWLFGFSVTPMGHRNNEIKSQSFLDFNSFFMYRLKKKSFITTKQTLIKDVIKEWNMEWLAERIKIR